MTDISLENLMAGEQITGMLKDVEGEPTSVKEIRRLIREVHEAFFGSDLKTDDTEKKRLLLNLIQGYKPNSLSDEEKVNYPYFDAANKPLAVFNMPLGGKEHVVSAPSPTESGILDEKIEEEEEEEEEEESETKKQEEPIDAGITASQSDDNEFDEEIKRITEG